jgi:hypothetical protein
VLAKRVDVALENGTSPEGAETFKKLLIEYEDIFALKLGKQPPCKFKPLRVTMPADVSPIRARPRPLPAAKRCFVQQETAQLAKYGMIFAHPTSAWAHPVLVVPKPGPAQYRLTVDLRQGNALQKQYAYPMPHLEPMLHDLKGTTALLTY